MKKKKEKFCVPLFVIEQIVQNFEEIYEMLPA